MTSLQKSAVSPRPNAARAMILISAFAVTAIATFGLGIVVGAQTKTSAPIEPKMKCMERNVVPVVPAAQGLGALGPLAGLAGSGWDRGEPLKQSAEFTQWATSVRQSSSEWSASQWSAAQLVGAPNVFPTSSDNPNAWASLSADGGEEFVEVGFAQAMSIGAVHVVETFNAGAIRRIEGITESGESMTLFSAPSDTPAAGARIRRFAGACTEAKIVAVRVTLASHQVAGWNEIDAIGVVACQTTKHGNPSYAGEFRKPFTRRPALR
jgi:hypothetical protein